MSGQENSVFDISNFTQLTDDMKAEEAIRERNAYQIAYIIFSLIFLIIGVPANTMVCVIVARQREERTSLGIFFANLAVADLLAMMKFMAYTLEDEITGNYDEWALGHTMCIIACYTDSLLQSFESITLTTALIVFTFFPQIKIKNTHKLMIVLWIVSSIAAIPHGYFSGITNYGLSTFCFYDDEINFFGKAWKSFLKFLMPWIALMLTLIWRLTRKANSAKMNLSLLIVHITFLLFLSPVRLLDFLHYFTETFRDWNLWLKLSCFSYFLHIYKPLMYFSLDDDFRREFARTFKTLRNRMSAGNSVSYVRQFGENE